jgi:hypothetical protein
MHYLKLSTNFIHLKTTNSVHFEQFVLKRLCLFLCKKRLLRTYVVGVKCVQCLNKYKSLLSCMFFSRHLKIHWSRAEWRVVCSLLWGSGGGV